MKKISILLLSILIPSLIFSDDYKYQRYMSSAIIGNADGGSLTNFALDSNLIYGTSGDSFAVLFYHREQQTSGNFTVYAYCNAVTGTPTSSVAYIYNPATGTDPDRPEIGGSAQYTSANVDGSGCGTPKWLAYNFTGVTTSTSTGNYKWLLFVNTETVPASNYFNIVVRGVIDYAAMPTGLAGGYDFWANTNTNGWTLDGASMAGSAPIVICYNSGKCYGNPYVAVYGHLTNSNHRGFRFTPTEDMYIDGFAFITPDTNNSELRIYQGSNTIYSMTNDYTNKNRGASAKFPTLLLSGGKPYDFVQVAGANDNFGAFYTYGNNPPSDVLSVSSPFTYIDGTGAGSMVEFSTMTSGGLIFLSEMPAITSIGVIGN